MFLDQEKYNKENSKQRCLTYWNPSRTQYWYDEDISIMIGKREGYYFWDLDGKKYMNLHLNGGTFNLGHRNKEVLERLYEASQEFDIGNHHFGSVTRGYLAEKLVKASPGMQYAIFSSCGGEAVDVAIKTVRYATKRRKIVSLEKCYHGHTGLALNTGDHFFKDPFLCGQDNLDFIQVPMNDVEAMENVLKKEDVAGVIIETVPATYGFKIPESGYLETVKDLCEKYGTLYIADETQTGMMRSGSLWAIYQENVKPDVIVCGKGLSGGVYSVAATIMTKEAGKWVEEIGRLHTSTFGGSELGCAVAGKVLDITTRESTVANVNKLTKKMTEEFDRLHNKYPEFLTNYTQKGLIIGLSFHVHDGGKKMMQALAKNGVWAINARFDEYVLQFIPGLLCTDEYCDELFGKLEQSMDDVLNKEELDGGKKVI